MRDASDSVFNWSFTISVILLQVAMCGGAASYITSRSLAIMYGVILLPVWIVFLSLSIGGSAIYTSSKAGLTGFCPTDGRGIPNDAFHQLFQTYTTDIDVALVPTINKWMCSSQCPCGPAQKSVWTAGLTETQANTYNRTFAAGNANLVAFSFASGDYLVSNFFQCFIDWKTQWQDAAGTNSVIG